MCYKLIASRGTTDTVGRASAPGILGSVVPSVGTEESFCASQDVLPYTLTGRYLLGSRHIDIPNEVRRLPPQCCIGDGEQFVEGERES